MKTSTAPQSWLALATGLGSMALIASISPVAAAQQACSEDGDCAGGLVCTVVELAVDCAEGDDPCEQTEQHTFCAEPPPEPLLCDAGGACPAPLSCDSDHELGALCAFDEQPFCSDSDSECAAGFECVDLEPFGGCSQCGEGAEGLTCAAVPCAENGLNLCSPKPVACTSDADCAVDFTCGEVGPYDLQTGWSEDLVGTQACLSDGYAALNAGRVQGGDLEFMTLDDGGPMTTGEGGSGASGTGAEPMPDDSEAGAEADGESTSMTRSSGGCAVAGPGRPGSHASSTFFALLVLGLLVPFRRA